MKGIKKATVYVPWHRAEYIKKVLRDQPAFEADCLDEDITITNTARFDDGVEMDIKVCGVKYDPDGDNLPWTEAVLFRDGSEIGCSEPGEDYFGIWTLDADGVSYIAEVKALEKEEARYYHPELDLDGNAEELFIQARNGYIQDLESLQKVEDK